VYHTDGYIIKEQRAACKIDEERLREHLFEITERFGRSQIVVCVALRMNWGACLWLKEVAFGS
jgi:hypothetical protein